MGSDITISLDKPVADFQELWCYDPGATTGFALCKVNKSDRIITLDQIGERNIWNGIENDILAIKAINTDRGRPYACVVYEDFTLHQGSPTNGIVLIPVQVIGVIRFLCYKHFVPCFSQMPYERFIGKERDKIIEKRYPPLQYIHSHYGSATRHGVMFATKHMFNNISGTLIANKDQLLKDFIN